jgi:NADPH:quinone reductase-like Zn-dependent oxidoreductase
MRAIELHNFGIENLVRVERDAPQPRAHEVLVKFHAASLNYRDLMFVRGMYNPKAQFPAVPLSDGAGEVVTLGEGVTRWKVGDRVCPIFVQGWIEGRYDAEKAKTTLGAGDVDGVLRDLGAFPEQSLVRIPDHLSYEEAATLPCAALTAWQALVEYSEIRPGETVLTLGTGGVSVFAIQFAKMHGARVIATSSSDEKLARVRQLGADETINYKTHPDWEQEVLRLTGGVGVDYVVEVGGAGTLAKSCASTRIDGRITLIGVLAAGPGFNPISLLMKRVGLQGIFVGSRQMFEDMNAAISLNRLQPVIDRTFSFDEAPDAMRYMETGSHLGKIVIAF